MSKNTKIYQSETLIEAKLLKRYKRFLADVQLADGSIQTVHCPNPGSLLGVTDVASNIIWLRESTNAKRKLKYTWVLAELENTFVCVDTLKANLLIFEALKNKHIAEFTSYENIEREKVCGNSRFDIFLSKSKTYADCYMEIKSTTLASGEFAMFPDAKTERGKKHLDELQKCLEANYRAVQLFCIGRSDTTTFSPAKHIDPVYASTLAKAFSNGVEIIAYQMKIERKDSLFSFGLEKQIQIEINGH